MAYTMWGQRKALGRRYGTDPALTEELARLEQRYAMMPSLESQAIQRESLAQQKSLSEASLAQQASQYQQTLNYNTQQSALNRALQEEQLNQSGTSSMISSGTNMLQNAAMMRMLTKGQGEPFFGKTISGYVDKLWGEGTVPTATGAEAAPLGTGTTQAVNPATTDYAATAAEGIGSSGAGYGLNAAAGLTEGDFLAATSVPNAAVGAGMETTGAAGAAGTVGAEAGASLGGAASAGLAAAPYAAAGYLAAKYGGELVTSTFGEHTVVGRLGKTISDPLQGVGRTLLNEFMPDSGSKETIQTIMDIFNPIGWVFSRLGCIIVTACTDPHSPEVEIAREYRDKFMSTEQLRGYYMIAEAIMPWVVRHRAFVKRQFVDRLVEYGRYHLGYTEKAPCRASCAVTRGFLMLCGFAGRRKRVFVRCNGEAV